MIRSLFFFIAFALIVGCAPKNGRREFSHPNSSNQNSPARAQGGDEGREGGHFLECDNDGSIPDSRSPDELQNSEVADKLFFIDYFLEVKTEAHRSFLLDFPESEEPEDRLESVVERLTQVLSSAEGNEDTIESINQYSELFMADSTEIRWLEIPAGTNAIAPTADFTLEDFEEDERSVVENQCSNQVLQAAIHDYTDPETSVFYYSEFFERHASKMQRSFRNVHEMLRYVLRIESRQIVKLTTFMHTQKFFDADDEVVLNSLTELSTAHNNGTPFLAE